MGANLLLQNLQTGFQIFLLETLVFQFSRLRFLVLFQVIGHKNMKEDSTLPRSRTQAKRLEAGISFQSKLRLNTEAIR
jgi:hypothetical protein